MAVIPKILFSLLAFAFVRIVNVQYYFDYVNGYFTVPPINESKFDFIVVGSGSGGSTVAGRLAEAGHRVLLLEAGGPPHFFQGIPALSGLFIGSKYTWTDEVPDSGAGQALKDGVLPWPRGKNLGGSSMLNWMLYVRGHPEDYDEWEKDGNPGWGFKNVERYFRKSREGPLSVESLRHKYPVNEVFLEAFQELGYETRNMNEGKRKEGFFGNVEVTTKDGKREGTFKSYVEPLIGKKDITVVSYAHVTKVLFLDKRAFGVRVSRFGEEYDYLANKEVILSAGTVGSAQILLLSGIGPKQHLEDVGISQINELPVGQNLQDHLIAFLSFSTSRSGLTTSLLDFLNPLNLYNYFINGIGPLTDNNLATNGFISTSVNLDKARPDIQIHSCPFSFDVDYGKLIKPITNLDDETFEIVYGQTLDTRYSAQFMVTLLHPQSRGTLKLKSKNPLENPDISPDYLSRHHDLITTVEALKFTHNLKDTNAFRKYGLELQIPDTLNCGDYELYSDNYWSCYARHWSGTIAHPVGTCKMGPKKDPGAVVDYRLRVHGLSRLRVVDASVMPKVVGGNTHAATVMIGEKAAHMILDEWGPGDVEFIEYKGGRRDEF